MNSGAGERSRAVALRQEANYHRRAARFGATLAGLVALGLSVAAGTPQDPAPSPPDVSSLDAVLAPVREAHNVPGLVGAIVRGGHVVASGAAGVRKEGEPGPIRADDVVHLGSDTKAMTAALLGLLVEDGKLEWSSTLAGVFPAEAAAMHPDYRAVTLEQLLTHRAGLPADAPYWRP